MDEFEPRSHVIVGSRAYDHIDTPEILSTLGDLKLHGDECDPLGSGVWEDALDSLAAFLGSKAFRLNGWTGCGGDMRVHSKPRA